MRALVRGLGEGSSKTQQTYLNLLNMGLQGGVRIGPTRLQTQLMADERVLVPTLVGLLEHASEVLRAKALVAGWALCQASTRWLAALCNAKVVSAARRSKAGLNMLSWLICKLVWSIFHRPVLTNWSTKNVGVIARRVYWQMLGE